MARTGERWPPVYDAESLAKEIVELTKREDLAAAFFEWRRDASVKVVDDVCQGDIVELASGIPVVGSDGEAGVLDHPGAQWLVTGNTCDFDRPRTEVQWTQLVPIFDQGGNDLAAPKKDALRKYSASRVFYVPPWSEAQSGRFLAADFLRPVAVDKNVFASQGDQQQPARVVARLSRPAWILLNACLVRFLARDDGRYDL